MNQTKEARLEEIAKKCIERPLDVYDISFLIYEIRQAWEENKKMRSALEEIAKWGTKGNKSEIAENCLKGIGYEI